MNKSIKYLALAAIVMSGLGFSRAEAASVSVRLANGNVAVVVSDNGKGCGKKVCRDRHNINDRRHLERCGMCRDAARREMERRDRERREMERRERERREAARRAAARKDHREARRR